MIGNLLSTLINLGSKNLSIEEQPIGRLINGLALICFVILTVCSISLCFIDPFWEVFFEAIIHVPVFLTMLVLSYLNKSLWNKWLFVIYINISIVTMHFDLPYTTTSWFFFLPVFIVYIAFFNNVVMTLTLSLITSCFLVTSAYYQSLPSHQASINYPKDQIFGSQMALLVSAILLTLLLTHFIKSNLVSHQKKLEHMLKEREVLLKEVFALPFVMSGKSETTEHRFQVLDDNHVIVHTAVVRKGQQMPGDSVLPDRKTTHLRVFQEESNGWKIKAHLISDARDKQSPKH